MLLIGAAVPAAACSAAAAAAIGPLPPPLPLPREAALKALPPSLLLCATDEPPPTTIHASSSAAPAEAFQDRCSGGCTTRLTCNRKGVGVHQPGVAREAGEGLVELYLQVLAQRLFGQKMELVGFVFADSNLPFATSQRYWL
eukprot:366057-Chlamydomonas_euryale.AAC.1